MWKDWLERTLTRNNAPVMLASEIFCVEAANSNIFGSALPQAAPSPDHADETLEPVEVQ
jgi:hypothetical protein